MQPANSEPKYKFVKDYSHNKNGEHLPISDAEIRAHIAGRTTLGVPLIGIDGLSRFGVIELDQDGQLGAKRVQAAAQRHGIILFSIVVKGAKEHDGSHNYALFPPSNPRDVRTIMRTIATDAGYPEAEIFPTENGKSLRLLLGAHTWSEKRGAVLLPDGELLDTDKETHPLHAYAAIAILPTNPTPPPALEAEPKPELWLIPARSTPTHSSDKRGLPKSDNAIAAICAQNDLEAYLLSRGATQHGNMYSCPCGRHAHGDKHPSLTIRTSRDDKQCAVGHATNCLFSLNNKQKWDFVNVVAALEGISISEVVKRYSAPYHRSNTSLPTEHTRMADEAVERAIKLEKDRTRQRENRQKVIEANEALQAAIIQAAVHDPRLTDRDRDTLLDIHIHFANKRDWHQVSVARQAGTINVCERTLRRINRRLEKAGFLQRDDSDRTHTARWTLYLPSILGIEKPQISVEVVTSKEQPIQAESALCHPNINIKHVLDPNSLACERPPLDAQAQAEPEPVLASEAARPEPESVPAAEPVQKPVSRRFGISPKEAWLMQALEDGSYWLEQMRVVPESELEEAPAQLQLDAGDEEFWSQAGAIGGRLHAPVAEFPQTLAVDSALEKTLGGALDSDLEIKTIGWWLRKDSCGEVVEESVRPDTWGLPAEKPGANVQLAEKDVRTRRLARSDGRGCLYRQAELTTWSKGEASVYEAQAGARAGP